MKKNYKGFSLLELVVSMALLTFVMVISSAIFDKAIHLDNLNEDSSRKNADNYSKIQLGIDNAIMYMDYNMKKEKGDTKQTQMPEGYTDPIYVKTNLEIKPTPVDKVSFKKLEGYTVTLDKGKYKYRSSSTGEEVEVDKYKLGYNNIDEKTETVTFVGRGNTLSESSLIDITIDNDKGIFSFFPLDSKDMDIKLKFTVDNDSKQYIKSRINYLKSPCYSITDNSFYKPYSNILNYYERVGLLYPSVYEYAKEATETNENQENGDINWYIESFKTNKDKYINNIDKSYAASAITLNSNGKISPEDATFDSKIPVKHLIGLPFIDNLSFFVDYNLLIARNDTSKIVDGKRHNMTQYLNMFLSPQIQNFNSDGKNIKNIVSKQNNNIYTVEFEENKDVRDIIEIEKNNSDSGQIKLSKGFLPKIDIKSEEYTFEEDDNVKQNDKEKNSFSYPLAVKSYGNSVYYNVNTPLFVKHPDENTTTFVKFNNKNYAYLDSTIKETGNKRAKNVPYVLVSNNADIKNGRAIKGNKGNFIYIDEYGSIRKCEVDAKRITSNKTVLLENANLYDDDIKFKFDDLSDFAMNDIDKRDPRADFNICQITTESGKYSLKILYRVNKSKNLQTKTLVYNEDIKPEKKLFENNNENLKIFVGVPECLYKNIDYKTSAMEVSDILVYDTVMDNKKSVITLNYLYRKYLTPKERESFDEYYKSIL